MLRVGETTKEYLINAPLPTHGGRYTVVSHRDVIDNTIKMLTNSGFTIERELYKSCLDAKVAQGVYHIKPTTTSDPTIANETELGMMFAWTNSYDKSKRFQCAIGGYVAVCSNGMLCGEVNYARKHTGTADQEIKMQISSQIKNAEKHFREVIDAKNYLRTVRLSKDEQAEYLGRMLITEDIIKSTQLNEIVREMKEPSYDYKCDQENAWAFYNHVTHGLKSAHPRSWISDTAKFHKFITADLLANMGIQKSDTTKEIAVDEFAYLDDIDLDRNPNITLSTL
jgi:hypothetical protein